MILHPTINRSVLLVIPKQPFYDWSNALFPDSKPTLITEINEYNSYLLEDEIFIDNPKRELKKYWKKIFINELYGQCMSDSAYPELTWKRFTEWFDFHRSAVVSDLTDELLYREEYE